MIVKKTINPAEGRNEGARIAKGEVLVFLDADTHLRYKALKEVIKKVNKGFVAGSFLINFKDANLLTKLLFEFLYPFQKIFHLLGFKTGNGPCMFITKTVFKKINGFNTELDIGEDNDLIRRASKYGKTTFINYRADSSNRRMKSQGLMKSMCIWFKGQVQPYFSKKISQKNYWRSNK